MLYKCKHGIRAPDKCCADSVLITKEDVMTLLDTERGFEIYPSDSQEIERCDKLMQENPNAIFVFGSNTLGRHGKGAAKTARDHYGAIQGEGEGPMGRSYAIPTKLKPYDKGLPLDEIQVGVYYFLNYAAIQTELLFVVTRIGCGEAGYFDADIAPMFKNAPSNCYLPPGWR